MKALILLCLCLALGVARAEIDYHAFSDPQQEADYQNLISELRCLVCQNQTIADSNADLAKDLRRQVYEMLQQGQSRQQIVDFMTERYGDFVLYRPAFTLKTGLLWLGPALFVLLALLIVLRFARQRHQQRPQSLSNEQQSKLRQLLEDEANDE